MDTSPETSIDEKVDAELAESGEINLLDESKPRE